MRTVRQHYNIQSDVPFLDVMVDEDNLIFMDLHAIRLSGEPAPYRGMALRAADSFLHEVAAAILDGSPAAMTHGRSLLSCFREPWQTRLGMSASGFYGRGGSDGVGDMLFEALAEDPEAFAVVGLLKHLEQIPLFVDGVGSDICSDLTTRVIFESLASFTTEMLSRYPELRDGAVRSMSRMWDTTTLSWVDREVLLPAPDGRPLLLVPNGWARRNPLMSASRFHDVTVVGYVQDAEAAYSAATRRMIKTPKKVLAKRGDLRDVRISNLRVTLRARADGADLLESFEAYLADWYRRQQGLAA